MIRTPVRFAGTVGSCLLTLMSWGCASLNPPLSGASRTVEWRVSDLLTTERDAGDPGRGGQAVIWNYTITLKETAGVPLVIDRIESFYVNTGQFAPVPVVQQVRRRLPAHGEMKIRSSDTDWLSVPRGFAGAGQSSSTNGVSKKTIHVTDESGQEVKLPLTFRPSEIPKAIGPIAAEATLLRAAFFKQPVAAGTVFKGDGSNLPPSHETFDAEKDEFVVFYYSVKQEFMKLSLTTVWHDPTGRHFETFTRALDQTGSPRTGSHYTTNVVRSERIKDRRGRWSVSIFINDTPAGRYFFTLR